ncbi:DEAD/DEAH box helicase [Sphingobacterium thalpophilum]|uniref:DEAD/DEAH box helicase n=1 Tax=Sphingobacterium thalpophilum TaxID=259 RepID=A0ABV4HJS0_9SPHI
MAFELLSEPIRRYVKDKRWESLRPIQVAAIEKIMKSDNNVILASRTASGKTEAAFLPILSKISPRSRVQVLYISPLIALINDQFVRIDDLCGYLDVKVTKWHGEANRTAKEHLIKDPNGVILITPESLEAMLINKPQNAKILFNDLKYIVIDEIHSFIGTDRGIQLKSILHRIQKAAGVKPSIVGLSATLGDFEEAKCMTGRPEATVVLRDRTAKDIVTSFRYFESGPNQLSLELLKDLYKETYSNKVLVFPNSRGRAEEVAVKLKRIAEKVKGHTAYYSHHSSVDRELREWIEHFAKTNTYHPFVISCTSTLELGIDIGSVEKVVQIDATHSIASLIQRVGRSGRKNGQASSLLLYSTGKWSLLQSLACWELYKQEFIEPPFVALKPFDLFAHQILAVVKQYSGMPIPLLKTELEQNFAFKDIKLEEFDDILSHLIESDMLEKLGQEVIIGLEGERIVNSRDFYSVFDTEIHFKVLHDGKSIGDLPSSSPIMIEDNILLAAKIWKVVDIDFRSRKIFVKPTNDGKPPIFGGEPGNTHPLVRQKMLELLMTPSIHPELDETCTAILADMREVFKNVPVESLEDDRPLLIGEKSYKFYTFQGSKIFDTLKFILSAAGIEFRHQDASASIEIDKEQGFEWSAPKLLAVLQDLNHHLAFRIDTNPAILSFAKWAILLPKDKQVELLKNRRYDFEGAVKFINSVRWVYITYEDDLTSFGLDV